MLLFFLVEFFHYFFNHAVITVIILKRSFSDLLDTHVHVHVHCNFANYGMALWSQCALERGDSPVHL